MNRIAFIRQETPKAILAKIDLPGNDFALPVWIPRAAVKEDLVESWWIESYKARLARIKTYIGGAK